MIFSVWRRSDYIFGDSGVAWATPVHDFRSPWALFGASRALPGRCWSSPGGHSDTPGTLFNSIWVLWHAQKVAGSMQKAILAYFGTLPHPPRGFPGGTLYQNPRFLVSRCAYLARARRYVRSTLNSPYPDRGAGVLDPSENPCRTRRACLSLPLRRALRGPSFRKRTRL